MHQLQIPVTVLSFHINPNHHYFVASILPVLSYYHLYIYHCSLRPKADLFGESEIHKPNTPIFKPFVL